MDSVPVLVQMRTILPRDAYLVPCTPLKILNENGGAGDASNPGISFWDRLPFPAQACILLCFDAEGRDYLRRVCKSMKHVIDTKFGRTMRVPSPVTKIRFYRATPSKKEDVETIPAFTPHTKKVTRERVRTRIKSLAGKRIISLEMSTPDEYYGYRWFPFDELINDPRWIEDVKLNCVTMNHVQDILGKCCNVKRLSYYTGQLPRYICPCIPNDSDSFTKKIIRLDILTSLTLMWAYDYDGGLMDSMNVILLLLTLHAPSLKTFSISSCLQNCRALSCLLLTCIAHFMCTASEKKLGSFTYHADPDLNATFKMTEFEFWLRELMFVAESNGNKMTKLVLDKMCDQEIQNTNPFFVITQSSAAFSNLKCLNVRLMFEQEMIVFLGLLRSLEKLEDVSIVAQSRKVDWNVRLVDFLQSSENQGMHACRTLRKLMVTLSHYGGEWKSFPTISLSRVLQKFGGLTSLKIETKYVKWLVNGQASPTVLKPNIDFGGAGLLVNFPNLEILSLRSDHIQTHGSILIKRLPNLQRLRVEAGLVEGDMIVNKRPYVVKVETLLDILHMRKLNAVKVDNIILPEGYPANSTGNLRESLGKIGKVEYDEPRQILCFSLGMPGCMDIGLDLDDDEKEANDKQISSSPARKPFFFN